MMAIDGRKQQLFLERVVLKALRLMVSGGLGKSSLHCVYSPPLEVEVWDYGRRCTFITIPTYVAPNYGSFPKDAALTDFMQPHNP